jgi:GGDEF domain-containing protein
LYPASIGEACFIDRAGAENARMVRGSRARVAELSPDESANPFFGPTFALREGQVHQARPYVSPDTNEWVISNSTTVPSTDGVVHGVVHFEVTVDSFREEAAAGSPFPILVVDADTGGVVVDTRRSQRVGAPLGDPAEDRFRAAVGGWQQSGRIRVGDRQAAYQRITWTGGNTNRWYAVALAPDPTGTFSGVGELALGIVVIAVLLLGYVAASVRTGHSVLVAAANTDALTGLHNRRRLTTDLHKEITRASEGEPLLLVLFDLNGFKSYNDAFGHPAGGALLARLAAALGAWPPCWAAYDAARRALAHQYWIAALQRVSRKYIARSVGEDHGWENAHLRRQVERWWGDEHGTRHANVLDESRSRITGQPLHAAHTAGDRALGAPHHRRSIGRREVALPRPGGLSLTGRR